MVALRRVVGSRLTVATPLALLVLLASACVSGSASSNGAGSSPAGAGDPGGGQVQQEVVVERMPGGSLRRTTITRRTVPAPAPAARPADAYPADPLVRYNVDQLNVYRARGGLPPLLYDAPLSAFATQGSQRLARDHVAHANFAEHAQARRFGSRSAENQGDPGGVPALDADPWCNATKQVDIMLKMMMDEGPGGGHHDNIMNPKLRRVGIGIVVVGNRFYMTNDFSD